jgi:hypothetical protein
MQLVEWVGEGRPVSEAGELTEPDTDELIDLLGDDVDLLLLWATVANLIHMDDGLLLPNPEGIFVISYPLELWGALWAATWQVGSYLISPSHESLAPSLFARKFESLIGSAHYVLYEENAKPFPIEALNQQIIDSLLSRYAEESPLAAHMRHAWRWSSELLVVLEEFEKLGLIAFSGVSVPRIRQTLAEKGAHAIPSYAHVSLTELGRFALNRDLAIIGCDVPVSNQRGAQFLVFYRVLVDKCVATNTSLAANEPDVEAWAKEVGPDIAGLELGHCFESSNSSRFRQHATKFLALLGEPGVEAARRAWARGGVAGAVAATFLTNQKVIEPSEVEDNDFILSLTDDLHAAIGVPDWITRFTRQEMDFQLDVVQRIANCGHPDVLDVLDHLSQEHPDRKVVKLVNKMRLRLRSA